MTYRFALGLSALVSLAGCVETAPACPNPNQLRNLTSDACVPLSELDGSVARDASDGAPPTPDAGPCGLCPDGLPVCFVGDGGAGQCVQCAGDGDCTGTGAEKCNPANECVQCLVDADCTDTAAAHCSGGSCVPCENSSQCAGTGAATLCDTARNPAICVECTGTSDCSLTQTCNLVTSACDPQAQHAAH